MKKTIKNKLMALALIGVGIVPIFIDGDATVLVLSLIIGVPMFFAKEDLTYGKRKSKKA